MQLPAYDDYKDCEAEFLNQVPSHWITWKVTHGFGLVGSGATPKSSNPAYYDGETPWITTSELRENVVNETKYCVTDKALKDYSTLKVYEPGALAIAMYGATIGRLGILGARATVNQACCVFDKPEQFDTKFFFYWLWMHRPTLISLSVGGGQPNLSQDDLKQLRVPVPPVEEQTQISKFLDYKTTQIDRLIEKKKALLEKLNEQRIAMITQAVSKGLNSDAPMKDSTVRWLGEVPEHWDVRKLKFMAAIRNGSDYKHVEVEEYEDGYPVYGSGGAFRKASEYLYDGSSVLFGRKGTIDKPLLVSGKFWTVDTMFYSEIEGSTDERFMFYSALTIQYQMLATQTALPSITQYDLSNYLLAYPEKKEQVEIANYLDEELKKMDNMLLVNNKAIDRLNEYRTTLITAAVTGKIDVRQVEVPEEY